MRKRRERLGSTSSQAKRVGLARALSKLGYCSRSQAAELIRAGRVLLNNKVRRYPETPVELSRDRIRVDGHEVESVRPVYLMLNKPRGIVTTASDEKGRETVYSLLPPDLPWLAPVGRLDKASEGLLLLTNDSEWLARITDPASHLDKTYHVQIRAQASGERPEAASDWPAVICAQLLRGVSRESELLRAKSARLLREGEKNAWLEIVLDEGRNRQIRRMLEALSFEVLRLVRVAIGPLQLGELAKASIRPLTRAEKSDLDAAIPAKSQKTSGS